MRYSIIFQERVNPAFGYHVTIVDTDAGESADFPGGSWENALKKAQSLKLPIQDVTPGWSWEEIRRMVR